jgi:uncharacterized protein YkwD
MKKTFYRMAAVIITVVLAFASIGCSKKDSTPAKPSPAVQASQAATPAPVEIAEVESNVTVTPEPAATSVPAGSGTNWDRLLDQYEKFVDDYIAAMKKAVAGDLSAMSTAQSLLGQAESLSERLTEASGEISTAQSVRLLNIQTKLANAAASLF